MAAHREENTDFPLGVYVGLSAGEPFAEDDDLFGDIGDVVPKGLEQPVRRYEIRWRAEGSP